VPNPAPSTADIDAEPFIKAFFLALADNSANLSGLSTTSFAIVFLVTPFFI